jgi:putative transcriptional regulator
MPYRPIEVDRKNRTIMGVDFSSVDNFEAAANAFGTVMFEGFDPTPRGVEIIRDYLAGKIALGQVAQLAKEGAYA